ncbi:MAG: GNAT family N-acetyltransferase [Thermoplasmata archaeon]
MKIDVLEQSHLEEACELFSASYRRQREFVPILDEATGTPGTVLSKLRDCLKKNPGVAAFDGGKLVGFMAGFYIDEFLSPNRGAYCSEWAHASADENAFEIYRVMYKEIGQRWVQDGGLTHAINCMEHACEAQKALIWSGFGGICFDAMRPVERIGMEPPEGIRISLIRKKDIPAWLPMVEASARHLAESPSFIPHLESETSENLLHFLGQPGNLAWMAWKDDETIGYMQVTPVGSGAAWVVNGERKFAINGAYIRPEFRGNGIARSLLSAIMDWGVEQGCVRCSVDFEATNLEACHFWLKHFKPVCRSFVRRLDARILTSFK